MRSGQGEGKRANALYVAKDIYSNKGIGGFFNGIGAALLRQAIYGTIRLGLYRWMSNYLQQKHKRNLTFGEKTFASMSSALIGCFWGNGADLALVRFQIDSLLPVE